MENENAYKNFDDLVFENRNKEYGAYSIRRSYNDNVSKAVLIAVFSSGLVLTLSAFNTTKKPIEKTPGKDSLIVLGETPTIIIDPPAPPKFRPNPTPPTNSAPVVTTEIVTDPPPVTNQPENMSSEGDENGQTEVDLGAGGAVEGPIASPAPAVPVSPPSVLNFAEVMPQFVGGHKEMTRYIQRTFRYPGIARRQVIEGTVYVSFVIDREGNVTDVKIEKGISKECDEEAKRIVASMPRWTPGRQGDVNVSVRQHLPIKFKLDFQ